MEDRCLLAISQPLLSFDGPGSNGSSPPDPAGDVGIDYYIQAVNAPSGAEFTVYDKQNGSVVSGPTKIDSLGASGFTYEEEGTYCNNGIGDPIVLFDHLAGRWLVSEMGKDPGAVARDMCVYISETSDPTGDWYSYAFDTPPTFDYPKFAVWPDAYYVGSNEVGGLPVYALDRTNMLMGNAPRPTQRFAAYRLSSDSFAWSRVQVLMPGDLDGMAVPPAGSPMYFYRHIDDEAHFDPMFVDPNSDIINVWELHIDWINPNNSTFVELDLEINAPNPKRRITDFDSNFCPTDDVFCIAQPQTGPNVYEFLDSQRTVPMWRLQYRNFGTHESLIGNFTVGVNETSQAGVRWFEMRKTSTTEWQVHQDGTISPDPTNRWLGSIAMDGSGVTVHRLGKSVGGVCIEKWAATALVR